MKTFKGISGADMAEWCALLADDNAIHLSQSAAEAAGFGPRRVNPGPANLAYVLSCLSPDQEADVQEIDAQFLDNVFEDDTVEARIEDGRATLTRDGSVVVTATLRLRT
jgi:acyl dehydratase